MNEKRGDEVIECAASAIHRLGDGRRNRNHPGGVLSAPSLRAARNRDPYRVLRCHCAALAVTYAIVGAGFFLLHGLRTENTEGQQLAAELGNRPRVVTATGCVISEPKI